MHRAFYLISKMKRNTRKREKSRESERNTEEKGYI